MCISLKFYLSFTNFHLLHIRLTLSQAKLNLSCTKKFKKPELFRENITAYFFNTLKLGINSNVLFLFLITRNRNKLVLPITQKSHTQAAFLFQGIAEWNALSN